MPSDVGSAKLVTHADGSTPEVDTYIARFIGERGENGHRLAVHNGAFVRRDVPPSAAGSVPVVVPRVNDKRIDPETGERQRFSSAILPPWARKTPSVDEVLVLLGVRADGRKELVALADGYRETAESWPDLLRDGQCRGMRAPVALVRAGARFHNGKLAEHPDEDKAA